jgi:hypothetical protein
MVVFVNRAKMTTATTGTGTLTLGAAVDGYQSFSAAGVADGNTVRYVIEDGADFEIGTGTYTAAGTTLSRSVEESSNADAAINLSGSATVFVGAAAADLLSFVTLSGAQTVTDKTLTAINYRETVGAITSSDLDLSTGNVFSDAPGANVTYTFSNPPASGTAFGFTLKVTPSATITWTWPASVSWPAGTTPNVPASGQTDVLVFYTQDGGTTYYGFLAGDAMS